MGRLVQGPGNVWRYIIDDFSGGMGYFGPAEGTYVATENIPENMYTYVAAATAKSRAFEPMNGAATYSVGVGTVTQISGLCAYQHSVTVLIGVIGQHFYTFLAGSTGTLTSVTEAGGSSAVRMLFCQFLNYGYKTGTIATNTASNTPTTPTRFNLDAPGSGRNASSTFITVTQVGKAGTPCPTNAPTMAISTTAGGLTTGTTYKYRLAWKYGTGGELGMGWKESSTSITVTGPTQAVSITVDQHPPNEYCHVVKRSLYRNTTDFQENFFLVTESAYTNSLPSSILDTASDDSIRLLEQTDPLNPADGTNTASDPWRSEMLPPRATFCCIHSNRVWLGDLVDSAGTRKPTSVAYSEISGISPRPDQFRPKNHIPIPGGRGRMTGLVEWMSNLYCIFERAIFVLDTDPGPGRLPTFHEVVNGWGATSPLSIAVAPEGIYMLSGTLPILFQGGSIPVPIGERVSALLRYAKMNNAAGMYGIVGAYDQDLGSYSLNHVPFIDVSLEYIHNNGSGYWFAHGFVLPAYYAAYMDGSVFFASRQTFASDSSAFVFRKGADPVGFNRSGFITRSLFTKFDHFGLPGVTKHLRSARVYFANAVTPSNTGVNDFLSFHVDGSSTEIFQKSLPGTRAKVFDLPLTSTAFVSLQMRAFIGGANTSTSSAVVTGLEIEFTKDDERYQGARS